MTLPTQGDFIKQIPHLLGLGFNKAREFPHQDYSIGSFPARQPNVGGVLLDRVRHSSSLDFTSMDSAANLLLVFLVQVFGNSWNSFQGKREVDRFHQSCQFLNEVDIILSRFINPCLQSSDGHSKLLPLCLQPP